MAAGWLLPLPDDGGRLVVAVRLSLPIAADARTQLADRVAERMGPFLAEGETVEVLILDEDEALPAPPGALVPIFERPFH